jgi:receptor-binding and translocation channel-forming TcA subunit of Tc toxin/ABC toxin-like protein
MRFESQDISLWYGTVDAPAPRELVPQTDEITLTIGVQPADASNKVEVAYRVNHGSTQRIAATWLRHDISRKAQYFLARFPGLRVGDTVEYTVICRCAGRQVPGSDAQQFPSSFQIVDRVAAASTEAQGSTPLTSALARATAAAAASGAVAAAPRVSLAPQTVPISRAASRTVAPGSPTLRDSGVVPTSTVPPTPKPPGVTRGEAAQPDLTLAEITSSLGLSMPQTVLSSLAERGIHTIGDLRNAGGFPQLDGISGVIDPQLTKRLDAHANLSLLSTDIHVREAVIHEGFENILKIARTDRADFVQKTYSTLGDLNAGRLHAKAQAEAVFLNNVITDISTHLTYDIQPILQLPPEVKFPPWPTPQCSCQECQSAVSPLSYLADLIKYVKDNVRDNGNPVDYIFLEKTFYQRLGTLPFSCDSVKTQVRQVRMCIEVLRAWHKVNTPINLFMGKLWTAEANYLLTAYQMMLNRLGTSLEELRLIRNADPDAKKQLAERLGLDEPKPGTDHLQDLLLDPENTPRANLEDKLESLFGLQNTRTDPLASRPTPLLLTWRCEHLRELWRQQDWPSEEMLSDGRPIIDPDVIGPDDFRTATASDKAFAIWSQRRVWVDQELGNLAKLTRIVSLGTNTLTVPDIEKMLDSMYMASNYPVGSSPTATVAWPATIPKQQFKTFLENLSTGQQVEQTAKQLKDELGLSVDAFTRLMTIWNKESAWLADSRNLSVSDAEWSEIYSILVQARKRLLFADWRKEENNANFEFGPNEFWNSLREPGAGDWPPIDDGTTPLIDPELIKATELPDSAVGDRARAFFQARQAELAQIHADLKTTREDPTKTFTDVLKMALGSPIAVDLDQTLASLNSSDPIVSSAAESDIRTKLFMSPDAFRRIMAIRAEDAQPDASKKPTALEYEEVYGILTAAEKQRVKYPTWRSEEANAATGVNYWSALKAKLPPWRASADARVEWQQALRIRMRPAIIDPDLIDALYIKDPSSNSPAWLLWSARSNDVKNYWSSLKTRRESATSTLAGLDAIIVFSLGTTAAELTKLEENRAKGTKIALRLAQLSLTTEAFDRLVLVARLASQNQTILSSEWEAVYSILTEAWKERNVATWHEGERGKVILTPDLFQLPPLDPTTFPPPPQPDLPAWRATFDALWNWEAKLQSRIDQDTAVEDALRQIVDATEEATLPALRDALIMAMPIKDSTGAVVNGADLQAHAKKIGALLLIETQDVGCSKTTRVSQAIETLQSLIFSIRTGELDDAYRTLDLKQTAKDTFDDDWQWMGSYSPWRAAMFVFLYPENILLPSLRRAEEQTPAFRNLVKACRSGGPITPRAARDLAQQYADYFHDVCTLEDLKATVTVHRDRTGAKLLFLFGINSSSNKIYWCTRDGASTSAQQAVQSQTFWAEVPSISGALEIIGAVEYRSSAASATNHCVYLFARTNVDGQKKLVFAKYDIENETWHPEAQELKLPNDATDFKLAKLFLQTDPLIPPALYIKLFDDTEHIRSLSQNGNDWSKEDFGSTTETVQYAKWFDSKWFDSTDPKISKDDPKFTPQIAAQWRFEAHKFAIKQIDDKGRKFVSGFPNFHEAGDNHGVIALTEDIAKVVASDHSTSGLLDSALTGKNFADWCNAAHQQAIDHGSAAGYPVFDDGTWGNVVFIHGFQDVVFSIDWPILDLGARDGFGGLKDKYDPGFDHNNHAAAKQISFRFTGTHNLATTGGLPGGPYEGAFPTFSEQQSVGTDKICCIRKEKTYEKTLPPFVVLVSVPDSIPFYQGPFEIVPKRFGTDSTSLANRIKNAFDNNKSAPSSLLTYFEEAWYFVPMHLALQLQLRGYYTETLDWFSTVYDYSAPAGQRKIYYGLILEGSLSTLYTRDEDWSWLRDPLDPHAIARKRQNTYTRFTLLALARCFLNYADAEFTRDTPETVPLAQTLYQTALRLLDDPDLKQDLDRCSEIIGWLRTQFGDEYWVGQITTKFGTLGSVTAMKQVQSKITGIMGGGGAIEQKVARIMKEIEAINQVESRPTKLHESMQQAEEFATAVSQGVMAMPGVADGAYRVGATVAHAFDSAIVSFTGKSLNQLEREPLPWLHGNGPVLAPMQQVRGPGTRAASLIGSGAAGVPSLMGSEHNSSAGPLNAGIPMIGSASILHTSAFGREIPALVLNACIPPNPVLRALRMHAEVNVHKIRSCRNIAGVKRELETYSAPTDTSTGMPAIGAGGQLVLPGVGVQVPTPYRFFVIIERAKHLVQLAQQLESSMLSTLQQRDAEAYSLMKARQDVQLARAGIKLQDLRVNEAQDSVKLAELQRDRAQIQVSQYDEWLGAGWSTLENASIDAQYVAIGAYGAATGAYLYAAYAAQQDRASKIGVALGAAGQVAAALAAVLSQMASYERRAQEWAFQKSLAKQDVAIGNQQIGIAQDQVRVVGQERAIAELQTQNTERTVDFLSNKFTNVELYDWMAGVLEGVYRYFIQQATAMANLASSQLAFERQEPPPPFIQADYWEPPSEDSLGGNTSKGPDRRGLTASERLLQDIYQLDQYAFDTNKRKLQLSKTLSVAQLAPIELQRFRETGVLTVATPMELFDHDFPGHYLRLVRRVKTSVVALIPPQLGIKATLTASRISRVVIGGDLFQTVHVQQGPDIVALTSPRDASGIFELDVQSDMLAPFEDIGVDATWEFRMPKASNQFDYNTIADVLLTLDYTALNSFDYYQEVVQRLRRNTSADRAFSFRQQFADAWYDLNNPELQDQAKQMVVSFETGQADFPPNIGNLSIQNLTLYFARRPGSSFEIPVKDLRFTEQDSTGSVGGAAVTVDGIVSTRRGNAGSWMSMIGKSPLGKWELSLPNTEDIKNRFKNDEIQDILFVITYGGRTPAWPM